MIHAPRCPIIEFIGGSRNGGRGKIIRAATSFDHDVLGPLGCGGARVLCKRAISMLMDTRSTATRCLRDHGRLCRLGRRSLLTQQMIHFTRCKLCMWRAMDFCGNFVVAIFQRNKWSLCAHSHGMFSLLTYCTQKVFFLKKK
jgi:hypothetical protein